MFALCSDASQSVATATGAATISSLEADGVQDVYIDVYDTLCATILEKALADGSNDHCLALTLAWLAPLEDVDILPSCSGAAAADDSASEGPLESLSVLMLMVFVISILMLMVWLMGRWLLQSLMTWRAPRRDLPSQRCGGLLYLIATSTVCSDRGGGEAESRGGIQMCNRPNLSRFEHICQSLTNV